MLPTALFSSSCWLAVSAAILLCRISHAQCQYEVAATLEYPLSCSVGDVLTIGISMNRHGTVVGYYKCPLSDYYETFLWTAEEGFTTLQRPPGILSAFPSDINDEGVICGTMDPASGGYRGFVYDHGTWTELPPVFPEGGWSWALALSNAGVIVGQRAIVPSTAPYNAYIWSPSTGFVDLGVMMGPVSSAYGITETGLIVGYTGLGSGWVSDGFVLEDGVLTFMGPVPGGFTSRPYRVNEHGVIVGSGRIPMQGASHGAPRAFLWKDGSYTMLGTLADHAWSRAKGVSPDGRQVVGRSWNVDGNSNIDHAFIWQDGVMTNLNDLVPPGVGVIRNASLVAEDGTIMAHTVGSRTVLLRPVGVPAGDLDLDCRVGVVDFLQLLADWGACAQGTDCRADLNGDGVVELMDFAILLDNWG